MKIVLVDPEGQVTGSSAEVAERRRTSSLIGAVEQPPPGRRRSWSPPIVTRTSATDPATAAPVARARRSRRRRPSRPSRTSSGARRREHPEVDRERLAALEPLLDPEEGHADEGVGAVDERRDRDVCGRQPDARTRCAVDQLEPDEGEEPERRRASARAARDRRAGGGADCPATSRKPPANGARDRPPGVEGAEDVAEEDAEHDQAEPEGDEDEGEREVPVGRLGARRAPSRRRRPAGPRPSRPASDLGRPG